MVFFYQRFINLNYRVENSQSATKTAIEIGIDVNTVCRLGQDYRKKHNLPSYAEEKGIKRRPPQSDAELKARIKLLEREVKEKRSRAGNPDKAAV